MCIGNPKLTGYSITEIFEVTTMLTPASEITLIASAWSGVVTKFNQNPNPGGTPNRWPKWDHNWRTHWNTNIKFCAFPIEMCSLTLPDSCVWHNQFSQRKSLRGRFLFWRVDFILLTLLIEKGRKYPKSILVLSRPFTRNSDR